MANHIQSTLVIERKIKESNEVVHARYINDPAFINCVSTVTKFIDNSLCEEIESEGSITPNKCYEFIISLGFYNFNSYNDWVFFSTYFTAVLNAVHSLFADKGFNINIIRTDRPFDYSSSKYNFKVTAEY